MKTKFVPSAVVAIATLMIIFLNSCAKEELPEIDKGGEVILQPGLESHTFDEDFIEDEDDAAALELEANEADADVAEVRDNAPVRVNDIGSQMSGRKIRPVINCGIPPAETVQTVEEKRFRHFTAIAATELDADFNIIRIPHDDFIDPKED